MTSLEHPRADTLRRLALAVALATIALAFTLARPAATPGPLTRDFESYYAAGRTWAVTGDPYGRDVWRAERGVPGVDGGHDELPPFVGPPFSLPLWRAFGTLPYPAAAHLWQLVLVLATATLAFGSLTLAGIPASRWDAAAIATLALAYGPLTSAFALGQVALVAAGAVVATLLALRAGRARAAAAAAIVAALQPNLAVVLVMRFGDRRAAFALAFAALVVAGGSLAAVGTAGVIRYVELLGTHAAAERTLAIQMTAGAIAYGFGASELAAQAFQIATSLVAVVLAALAAVRCSDPVARVAVASAALPFALPFAHEHDLVLVLFPIVFCLRRAAGWLRIVATLGAILAAVDWLGLAQRPSGFSQSLLLAVATAAACFALGRQAVQARDAAPLVTLVAVALAGVLAAGHALPVWPDALGAFHAPLALDAPSVWHLEQVLSGIAGRDPVWAALRTLSLLGCALVWFATWRAKGMPLESSPYRRGSTGSLSRASTPKTHS